MKPPTPWPPVTVTNSEQIDSLNAKKWTHISVRINDATIKDIAELKEFYPGKSQADIIRWALKFLLESNYES